MKPAYRLALLALTLAACSPNATAPSPIAASLQTPTPDGAPGPAGAAPCVIVVRTPAPGAPTASANGTALPQRVDPHVEVCVNAPTVKVGETLTVLAQAVDIGQPDYVLMLGDQGGPSNFIPELAEVTYDNQLKDSDDVSQVFKLVSLTANGNHLRLTLRAGAPGQSALIVNAALPKQCGASVQLNARAALFWEKSSLNICEERRAGFLDNLIAGLSAPNLWPWAARPSAAPPRPRSTPRPAPPRP